MSDQLPAATSDDRRTGTVAQPAHALPRDAPPLPAGLLARAIATLDPGYFAVVMASGIVSIGTSLLGFQTLSRVTLAVTVAAFIVLTFAYAARAVWFGSWMRRSLGDPTTAVAYFTVVAGTDVLATRLVMAGHPTVAFGMGVAAAIVWLALTYGLPWSIVAGGHRPVLAGINGTWLIWVVSTQSLSIVAAAVASQAPTPWLKDNLPIIAVCMWGLGVMLYLVLIVIVFLRLLLVEVTPAEMGPAYWIAMGATAISVRAAAGILALHSPQSASLVEQLRPFDTGLSLVLWAFGTWWIPLLVLFGIWRYLIRGYPRTYEPRLWSVVFPLGMYTVACWSLGHTTAFTFMTSIARVWIWVGVAAWVVVLVLMGAAFFRTARHEVPPNPPSEQKSVVAGPLPG
jgi:tellurite resistance protein TehA-like permease